MKLKGMTKRQELERVPESLVWKGQGAQQEARGASGVREGVVRAR